MQVNYPTRNRPLVKTTIVVITCTTKLTVQYWDALSPCPNKGKEIHMCVLEKRSVYRVYGFTSEIWIIGVILL